MLFSGRQLWADGGLVLTGLGSGMLDQCGLGICIRGVHILPCPLVWVGVLVLAGVLWLGLLGCGVGWGLVFAAAPLKWGVKGCSCEWK